MGDVVVVVAIIVVVDGCTRMTGDGGTGMADTVVVARLWCWFTSTVKALTGNANIIMIMKRTTAKRSVQ